ERKYKRVTKGLFDDESDTGGKKVRGLYTVNPGERRDFYEQHKEQQEEREQTLARNRNIMAKSYDRFRNDPFGAQASPAEKVRVSKAYYDSLSPITRMAAKTVNKIYNDAMKREKALNARSGLSFEKKLAEADRLERSSTTNIGGNRFLVTPNTGVKTGNLVYDQNSAAYKANAGRINDLAQQYNGLVNGNVDYTKRPIISAGKMQKYYPEFGRDEVGTTYSSSVSIGRPGHEWMVEATPISENGSVMTEQELNDYLARLNTDGTLDDLLRSDTRKLVINALPYNSDPLTARIGDMYQAGLNKTLGDIKNEHWELSRDAVVEETKPGHGIDVSRYNNVYESPQAEAKALRRYAYETASEPELLDLEKRMQSGEYASEHKTDAALSMIGDIEQTYGKQKADMIRDVFYGGRRYDDVDPYTGRTVGDLIEDGMSLDDIDRVNAFYDRKTGTVNSFGVDSFDLEDVRAGLDFVRARDLESKKDRESAYFDDVFGQIQSDPRAPYLGYYANRYEDDTTGMGEVAEYVQLLLSEFGGDRGEENFKSKTTIQNLAGEVDWKVSRPDVNIPFMGADTPMRKTGALNGVAIDQDDLDWITEEEARKLLTLYNSDPKNGPQLALRYLRLISYDLKNRHDNRYTEYVGRINRRLDEIGPVAGALGRITEAGASVAMAPAAGVEGLALIPAIAAGIDLNDYEYAGIISDVQRGIRQSINEDIDSEAGRFLFNTGMSILDNVANMAAASGFGANSATGFRTLVKDSETAVLALMSASAGVP
ncbi:MAG: hypothetical protein IKQ18_06275, partial [Clostridia bacterium]|nr:hypothetical protein [Clostridia bacterium]